MGCYTMLCGGILPTVRVSEASLNVRHSESVTSTKTALLKRTCGREVSQCVVLFMTVLLLTTETISMGRRSFLRSKYLVS